jgi:hypothetical protein
MTAIVHCTRMLLVLLIAIGMPLVQFLHQEEHLEQHRLEQSLLPRNHSTVSYLSSQDGDEAHCPLCHLLAMTVCDALKAPALSVPVVVSFLVYVLIIATVLCRFVWLRFHPYARGPPLFWYRPVNQ